MSSKEGKRVMAQCMAEQKAAICGDGIKEAVSEPQAEGGIQDAVQGGARNHHSSLDSQVPQSYY
jgi:hypothetical protein